MADEAEGGFILWWPTESLGDVEGRAGLLGAVAEAKSPTECPVRAVMAALCHRAAGESTAAPKSICRLQPFL